MVSYSASNAPLAVPPSEEDKERGGEGGSPKKTACYMAAHKALHASVADPPAPALMSRLGG